ncbi:MAG: hypothetical protein E6R13_01585 [Spirochaetes bacterium]|nr:MAG: hypothetical protein E6R13_01585 [Spirochaetota bacterium]
MNVQRVADKDDYAKYQALQQLINGGGKLLYDDSMAGTASSVGVDKDRLKSVLDNKDTLINNTYNNLRPHWEILQGRWPSSFTGINDQTNSEMRRLLNSIEEYGVGNNPQDIQAV